MPRKVKLLDTYILEVEGKGYYTGIDFTPNILMAAEYPVLNVAREVAKKIKMYSDKVTIVRMPRK